MISGYYGFGNLGDEALAQVIVSRLRSSYPYAEIDVLSAQPELTAHTLRVESTPRMQLGAVRVAVNKCDVLISGGGGLLQNATSLRSLAYYAGVLRSARRSGKKTMIFAQSIGPLDFLGKTLVREWCKGVDRATVRDARSLALLSELLKDTPAERTADPVFLWEPDDVRPDLQREGIDGDEQLVVFSVRSGPRMNEGTPLLAKAADAFAKLGAHVAFLPIGGSADAEVATSVIRKCKSNPVLLPVSDLSGAVAVIRCARAVVGMRLHALIFAARFGVPFLAVPYDPKVASLCEDLRYPLPALWNPLAKSTTSEEQVAALVQRVWDDRLALGTYLQGVYPQMATLAERNFQVLDELVRKP